MPDLGEKHECPKCGGKYYDLGKADATCPRCGPDEEAEEESKKDEGGEEE